MTNYFLRNNVPEWSGPAAHSPRSARSAALLIDFDNVTLGVHSDLGRELKTLINSEVFRGKIAVRRAYADWRRFPNYVVPLTEASIDLIFAPAYGSSKKNTTDLRMSADAIELAFTRPEIDTFILLTGDSDFSSTVMKLKEYGKFVIGVGMRESSSDLIIQNCDEYFSYHALTGLTRTSAGEGMREDPWDLVVRAAQKMVSSGDAMRTDRLKQVMLSLDPGFNEKEIGYTKFSRFVHEADKKGLIRLQKLPDGQYEISIDGAARTTAAAPESREPRERREPREARDRGRGRGDRDRVRRRDPVEVEARPEPIEAAEDAVPAAEAAPAPVAAEAAEAAPVGAAADASGADDALALLQRAVRALGSRDGAARDGDVKRRMLEMDAEFDESKLGYSKFSRFLRFAHEKEAIDLERFDDGHYEVKLGARTYQSATQPASVAPRRGGAAADTARAASPAAATTPATTGAAAPAARPAPVSLRGRTWSRQPLTDAAGPPPLLPGQVIRTASSGAAASAPEPAAARDEEPTTPTAIEEAPAAAEAATPSAPAVETPADKPARKGPRAPVAAVASPSDEGAEAPARRGRRGRRGAPAGDTPPPLLPGQVVGSRGAAQQAEVPATAEAPTPTEEVSAAEVAAPEEAAAEAPQIADEAPRKRRRGGRGRKRGAEATDKASDAAEDQEQPAEETAAAAPAGFSADALNLPSGRSAIENYLTRTYKGVGKKTVEPLLDAFGEDIFRVFAEEPQRVEELLGDKRAGMVLEQWAADYERRSADNRVEADAAADQAADTAPEPQAEATSEESAETESAPRPRRRGGRGRKRKGENGTPAEAAEPAAATAEAESATPEDAAAEDEAKPQRRSRSRGGRGRSGRGSKGQPAST
jgi:uncharacterized protein (TIGR00288 family)